MTTCPCYSGKTYNNCCKTIIDNESAPTALALMRSRYTAYKIGKVEYLVKTNHESTRAGIDVRDIVNWSKEHEWTKLEIVKTEQGSEIDTIGMVEFKAHFKRKNGEEQIHHEKSTFRKEQGKWFYVDGQYNPKELATSKKISRNAPCPCGSGKKYKKCCG